MEFWQKPFVFLDHLLYISTKVATILDRAEYLSEPLRIFFSSVFAPAPLFTKFCQRYWYMPYMKVKLTEEAKLPVDCEWTKNLTTVMPASLKKL